MIRHIKKVRFDKMQNAKFKLKVGSMYVVTNECLKLIAANGVVRGKMIDL